MFAPENGILNTLHPSQHVAALEAAEVATPPSLLPCQTPFQPFPPLPAQLAPLSTACADGQRMLKSADVIIFNTTKPQAFPNGRDLDNDQIDLIGPYDPRVENLRRMEIAAGSPTANDVPHSATFPYLGLPQP